MVLLIVLVAAFGLTLLFFPGLWWTRFEARKHPEVTEPPREYLHVTRIRGGLFLLAAALLLIVHLFF